MSIIELSHVSFLYKGSEEGLLNDLCLRLDEGQTVLLCGASGCGKTSIIRLINGLIPHYYTGELEGDITVAGRKTCDMELHELAGTVGTVFQNPRSQFFSVDTDGEIVFGPENIGLDPEEIRRRAGKVTEEMNIGKLLGRSIFELSGGEKQKIACASVSALMPEIILLDEPSSNLDWDAIDDIRDAMIRWKEQGKTIVISEHRLWYLRDLVDRVIYLDKGKIVHDWNREEFTGLDEDMIRQLGLRPVSVESSFIGKFRSGDVVRDPLHSELPEEDNIILRDFLFSYEKAPGLLSGGRYTSKDIDLLSLNIPEMTLPRGKVIGVVGSNGAGKSTFLRCVCGLEKNCTGRIVIGGREYSRRKLLKLCYMVMQDVNHQLFTDSIRSEVMLSMNEEDEGRADEILESLGLSEYADKHPMALSGGQKQRVAIASAIAAGAEILLFDEPTSGLDLAHMEKVGILLRQLADSGKTVLVSTHDPELIDEICDLVLCIDQGTVKYMGTLWEKT